MFLSVKLWRPGIALPAAYTMEQRAQTKAGQTLWFSYPARFVTGTVTVR